MAERVAQPRPWKLPTPQPPAVGPRVVSNDTRLVMRETNLDPRQAEGLIAEYLSGPEARAAFAAESRAYHQRLADAAAAAGSPTVEPEPEPEPDQEGEAESESTQASVAPRPRGRWSRRTREPEPEPPALNPRSWGFGAH